MVIIIIRNILFLKNYKFGGAVSNMDVKEEKICRLCLQVAEIGFEIIDEITTHMFEVLMLKVNLDISKEPIICKNCTEILIKCFNFKSSFMDTEKLSFAIDTNRATFESKDVFGDGKDDNFICRFCSNSLSWGTSRNEVTFAEKLQVLVPEMNLDVIENLVICTSCREDLECYIKFAENCIDVEGKISNYCQIKGVASYVPIKLSDLVQFLSGNVAELDYTRTHIKQERVFEDIGETLPEVYNSVLIKAEEALDIKDEEVDFNETMPLYKLNTKNVLEAQIFKCLICTFATNSKRSLKNHTSIHKYVTKVKLYKCSTCAYETKNKSHLKTHTLLHRDVTEVEMYNCTTCTFKTKYKGSLKSHMVIHKNATEVEMYECSMCTFKTKFKNNLKNHTSNHENFTKLRCSMCAYEAKQKGHLVTHMLTHKNITEVEMYKCSVCAFQTKQKGNLKTHTLIHKDVTEVDMYKCTMCPFQAKQKGNLKTHMLTHRDDVDAKVYKCSICVYETNRKGSLIRHMLIHKDVREVRMYRCSICAYETKLKDSLVRHMLVHKDVTEVEMYNCSVCTFKTKFKSSLKNHLKKHKSGPCLTNQDNVNTCDDS